MTHGPKRRGGARTQELVELLGSIDIYLLDQLMRGRVGDDARILDVGCGTGRNMVYLLRRGFDVRAVDLDHKSVAKVRQLAQRLGASDTSRLQVAELGRLPFSSGSFDVVICSAVLHFARDLEHWHLMLADLWRVLDQSGMLWVRLATSIGLEHHLPHTVGHCLLPDGTERFVVDVATLEAATADLGARQLDPIKTVLVHGQRSMTTWCLEKT